MALDDDRVADPVGCFGNACHQSHSKKTLAGISLWKLIVTFSIVESLSPGVSPDCFRGLLDDHRVALLRSEPMKLQLVALDHSKKTVEKWKGSCYCFECCILN